MSRINNSNISYDLSEFKDNSNKNIFYIDSPKETTKMSPVYRGDVFYYDLGKQEGSLQSGLRPVVIVSNNKGNKYSSTVIVATITSKPDLTDLPTHADLTVDCAKFLRGNLKKSTILFEQIFTINKSDLKEKICNINLDKYKFRQPLKISLGL